MEYVHQLVRDLAPAAMSALNRGLAGGDAVTPRSFVSVGPPPGISPLKFLTAPVQRALYDLTWRLSSAQPPLLARVPAGPWIGPRRIPVEASSSDGMVPAWSQTLTGSAAGIVLADHLDVIGHYESVGATFLRSGSDFDEARFRALWEAVGAALDLARGAPGSR